MSTGLNARLPQEVADAMLEVKRLQEELRRPGLSSKSHIRAELLRRLIVVQSYHEREARNAQLKIDQL
jgi:hypothetical protein